MRILIDADGCPVVDKTIQIAKDHNVACILLCDTSHVFVKEGAKTITVSKGADSVDFCLVNLTQEGDIVITQDYGLAAMCMAKKAFVLNQNGLQYCDENIDSLLSARHIAKKIRRAGGHLKGPKKRTTQQDQAFEASLLSLLEKISKDSL